MKYFDIFFTKLADRFKEVMNIVSFLNSVGVLLGLYFEPDMQNIRMLKEEEFFGFRILLTILLEFCLASVFWGVYL